MDDSKDLQTLLRCHTAAFEALDGTRCARGTLAGIARDGMVSVDGNLYSVPNSARRRVVEVHSTASEVRILEHGAVIARIERCRHLRTARPRARTDPVTCVPAKSSRCGHGVL